MLPLSCWSGGGAVPSARSNDRGYLSIVFYTENLTVPD